MKQLIQILVPLHLPLPLSPSLSPYLTSNTVTHYFNERGFPLSAPGAVIGTSLNVPVWEAGHAPHFAPSRSIQVTMVWMGNEERSAIFYT